MTALPNALDAEQQRAVEALRGPVVVLAGAGAGKTRVITQRIAHGIATGTYAAGRVLALTFTAKAAAELRTRLRSLGAPGVSARTFHAAALSQLNFFWPNTIGGTMPSLVSGKAQLIAQASERLRLKLDTPTLRDVAAEVEWRKVTGLRLDEYARAGRPLPHSLTIEQTVDLLQGYETLKDERRQIDFEDVLVLCAGMIRQEASVAFQVREQFRFFVVDEYQDVSPIQQHLLDAWLGDRRDLCVVGDASQTIYSFTGATSDYLLGFRSRFPDATTIRLATNYRSTPEISAVANHLMRERPGALTLHAAPAARSGPRPDTVGYPSDIAEARGVANRIAELLDNGTAPEDIAILFRANIQSAVLEQALGESGIPFTVHGNARFFDRPEVKQALMALRGAAVAAAIEPLFKTVSDVLRSLGWSQTPPEQPGATRDRWESLNAIMDLADRAPEGTGVRAFADELFERQSAQHEPVMRAVTLATIHSVKGLEWESVFVVGVAEGLLPISYAQTPETVDEERRLLYVAITRARHSLTLTWARTGARQSSPRDPSRFLQEIGTRIRGGSAATPSARAGHSG